MFHLRSHLGDLGDDPSTTPNPLTPTVPIEPAVVAPVPAPGLTLQHLLIIGGIAAIVICLLSRKK